MEAKPEKTARKSSRSETILPLFGRYGTVIGLGLLFLVFTLLKPHVFLTLSNLLNILNQIALVSIISGGLTCAMVMMEFDLSFGTLSSFAGCLAIGEAARFGTLGGVVLGILTGMAVGLVNGSVVFFLGVSAFIATIGMMSILTGFTYWYTGGATIFYGIPPAFLAIARGNIAGIPNLVVIMAIVLFLLWLLLSYTEIGRQMYAVGGNPVAARFSGINIGKCKLVGFAICSTCAALTGILLTSRIGAGHPTGGEVFLLEAFTAVFLGAATIRVGQFHILGTLVGSLLMGVLTNGLTILHVQYFYQHIITGIILIVAVSASGITRRITI
jgi:ribose transport system permease protein